MQHKSANMFGSGILALILLLAIPGGSHAADPVSPCDRSTGNMRVACQFDVRDNYHEDYAKCRHVTDFAERATCFENARDERDEGYETCFAQRDARVDACAALHEWRYDPDPLLDPANTFIHPDEVPAIYPPNPYVSVVAGRTAVLRADGEIVVINVTGETREILGVHCRVVVDIVFEESIEGSDIEYEPVESTVDWFAQTETGDVVYCGEIAQNFEDGVLRDLDGSFEAGLDSAKSGFLIKALPVAGDVHRQEFALGEAEDIIRYEDVASGPSPEEGGDNPNYPCNGNGCLKTFEFAPLAPESTEFKYYVPGTGFVLAVGLEDGELTGEREELVCQGDSPDILDDEACGIADPDALREELCRLSPDAFCDD